MEVFQVVAVTGHVNQTLKKQICTSHLLCVAKKVDSEVTDRVDCCESSWQEKMRGLEGATEFCQSYKRTEVPEVLNLVRSVAHGA